MTSLGAKVLTGSILAVIGLYTVKVMVAVLSGFLALMAFLFFTVLPIVLVGWVLVKAFRSLKADETPAFE
jgi:hypothetical protein